MLRLKLTEFVRAPDACHFARARFTGPRGCYLHSHDFVEVFWVESGPGWHHLNDQRRFLQAGCMFFVRAEDRHDFACAEGSRSLELANLAFSRAAWNCLRRRYFGQNLLAWDHPDPARREVHLPPRAFRQLRAATEELTAGGRSRATLDRFLLNLLRLTDPIQVAPVAASKADEPVPLWLRRACEQVQRPAGLPKGVSEFVRHAARTPAHVSRACRRYLGCTPTEWVNHARLTYAAERLAGSDAKILDIIADCGSQNPSHFYQLFQARFGLTPRQFRLREQRVLRPLADVNR